MALDNLDFAVIGALVVGVALFFTKGWLWGDTSNDAGFVAPIAGGVSRDLLETLKKNNKNCVIFYGSQTGTAEDYASKFSKDLSSRFGLKVLVADLCDYDYDNLNEVPNDVLVFFIVATYGEGEPTDDAVEFWEFLQNEADEFSSLRFSVFGLGNSTYEFYNEVATKVDQILESKQAERFAPLGLGDDGVGTLDEDFLTWKDEVFDSLANNLNLEQHELRYEPAFELIEDSDLTAKDLSVAVGEPNASYISQNKDLTKGPFDHTHPYLAPITVTKELFNSKERHCVHAEFDLSDSNLRYSTGDHLAVWPHNSDYNIEKFVEAFGLQDKLDTVFRLKALDSTVSVHFPTPTTYGAVVRYYLEISGPVSRQLFLSIAPFAPNDAAKEAATKLGNDKAAFAAEVTKKHFNVADALLKISGGAAWTDVPFTFIIESIAHLQPRYYSISSSSLSEKTTIHITAVVEAEKDEDRLVTGVVTNLLKNIQIEQNHTKEKPVVTYDLQGPRGKFSNFKLPVHVRRSTFKLPSNPGVPVILIGPGTGVAPFRGFVREKIAIKESSDAQVGKTLLFYGCRNANEDFLYKDEWTGYSKKLGETFEMINAFSRDTEKKVYVQHKLLEHAEQIGKLLDSGAFIYVCGDASRMARDVQKALIEIVAKTKGLSEEKAADLIRNYKVQNRYQEDVW